MRTMLTLAATASLLGLSAAVPAGSAPSSSSHKLIPAATVAKTLTFEAPAGYRPAGVITVDNPYAQILPSGRIIRPSGTSVVVGMNALGVTLTPDGRYAIVSNDDEREAHEKSGIDMTTLGGFSLAVVDTATMEVVDRYRDPDESYFVGLAAERDPADPTKTVVLASGGPSGFVYVFGLDSAGHLTPDARHFVAVAAPVDAMSANYANFGKSFPSSMVLSPDGTKAYVVGNLGNNVAQIDVTHRATAGPQEPVGYFPLASAMTTRGLLVANEGLMPYANLSAPVAAPPFANPPFDALRASSLSLLPLNPDQTLGPEIAGIPLDGKLDGVHLVGGTHPSAIAAMARQPYAFVALGGVDRVATVLLTGIPKVVGGVELRLYDKGPYGTQPSAAVLSHDEKRLYIALAGINAVAVLDTANPLQPHRIGLIPTGWYPSALAVSDDDRYLFVANAKGFSHDRGFEGDNPTVTSSQGRVLQVDGDSNAVWSTLERIDLRATDLRKTTPAALGDERVAKPAVRTGVVPQAFGKPGSPLIHHVVFILEENKTYDSMLGDLVDATGKPYGPGDPSLVSFDASVTPNLHALARTYALAGNLFADAEESDAGHQFAAGGIASLYTERTLLVKSGRRPLVNKNEDPEDYPRAGYIFNSLAARHQSFRDYGDFVRVSGYDEGAASIARVDDPLYAGIDDESAPTQGLGGLYSLDVPAPAVLGGHVDLNYPGWNLRIRDVRRANEFFKDFDPLVKSDAMPAFTYIWLPADHGGAGYGIPPLPEEVADGDRALGRIVDYLTHIPQWASTAIFIMPDDAQSTRDHVNEHRTFAIVVSPYAKHHYVGMKHLSTVSVLKTEEEILGLPPLSLGEALATDMNDFFTKDFSLAPFTHVDAPAQTASLEGRRIAALLSQTDQSAPDQDSDRAAALIDLSRQADKLAARRASLPAATYAADQGALWSRARAVVEQSGDGE